MMCDDPSAASIAADALHLALDELHATTLGYAEAKAENPRFFHATPNGKCEAAILEALQTLNVGDDPADRPTWPGAA